MENLRTLGAALEAGLVVSIACGRCGRSVHRLPRAEGPYGLPALLRQLGDLPFEEVARRARCERCGAREARVEACDPWAPKVL